MDDQTVSKLLQKVDSVLRVRRSTQALSRFNQAYFSVGAGISVVREAPILATVASLFRPVPALLTAPALTLCTGASAIWSAVGAGNATWVFYGELRGHQDFAAELGRCGWEHELACASIKSWTARLSQVPCDRLAYDSKGTTGCSCKITRSLEGALVVERYLPGFRDSANRLPDTWITFLRDAVIQLASSALGFATVAKALFHAARVNVAWLPVVGSVLGMAAGGMHIAGGVRTRRQMASTISRCMLVKNRVETDGAALRQHAGAAEVAAFLLRAGAGPTGEAFGKRSSAGSGTKREPGEAAADHGPCTDSNVNVEVSAAPATPGNPDHPAPADSAARKSRVDRYAQHENLADAETLKTAQALCGRLFAQMADNQIAAKSRAEVERLVANKRIAFGASTFVLSAVTLGLSATGVGALAARVLSGLASAAASGGTAFWSLFLAYRARRSVLAATPAGSAQSDHAKLVDDIVGLLQNRTPEGALARKLVKGALREHGLSPMALRLLKFGLLHGERTGDKEALGLLRAEWPDLPILDVSFADRAVKTVRELVIELISGDMAREAVASGRVVDRNESAPRNVSVLPDTQTVRAERAA